jgi:SAM-dependent methyltransferase
MSDDPFSNFKAAQREGWSSFAPIATFTTPAAAHLVDFAGIAPGQLVLDVACGTGVVAVTAAQLGARVSGLDLAPALIEEAERNAALIDAEIAFTTGDAENLPYGDAHFDVVISQFGHMFAPRPAVVVDEMLRVLKPGGRIAFSTWPPDLAIGRIFRLVERYLPAPPGVPSSTAWGETGVIRERLGDRVTDLEFRTAEMVVPTLSTRHYLSLMAATAAPIRKVAEQFADQPDKLGVFRREFESIAATYFAGNKIHQTFQMSRARKL